jgi:hypothetical protein
VVRAVGVQTTTDLEGMTGIVATAGTSETGATIAAMTSTGATWETGATITAAETARSL